VALRRPSDHSAKQQLGRLGDQLDQIEPVKTSKPSEAGLSQCFIIITDDLCMKKSMVTLNK